MNNETIRIVILTSIILVSFAFAFLGTYYFYYAERKRVISNGIEDTLINKEIDKKKEKFLKKKKAREMKFKDFYFKKKKRNGIVSKIFGAIFSLILVLLCVVVGYGYIRVANNNLVFIDNKTLIVIKSESMQTVNSQNEYIKENTDNTSEYKYINERIPKYSLISIDKFEDQELKLFDICAFKMENSDGSTEIIVHRLINMTTSAETGITYYSFRGDANNASFTKETNITKDKIIGVYNGYQNKGLGYSVAFLQSEIGFIVIIVVALSLIGYQIFNDKIDSIYKKRFEELVIENDEKEHSFKDFKCEIKEKLEEKRLEIEEKRLELDAKFPFLENKSKEEKIEENNSSSSNIVDNKEENSNNEDQEISVITIGEEN